MHEGSENIIFPQTWLLLLKSFLCRLRDVQALFVNLLQASVDLPLFFSSPLQYFSVCCYQQNKLTIIYLLSFHATNSHNEQSAIQESESIDSSTLFTHKTAPKWWCFWEALALRWRKVWLKSFPTGISFKYVDKQLKVADWKPPCFFFQGVIWQHSTRLERPRRVSVLFPHRHAWFITQSRSHRFHPSLQMGHCHNVLAERGSSLVGCQWSRHTIRKGEHIMYSYHHVWRGEFQRPITDVEGN